MDSVSRNSVPSVAIRLSAWLCGPAVLALYCALAFLPAERCEGAGEPPVAARDLALERWGVPEIGTVYRRHGYLVGYDGRDRGPRWVLERITKKSLSFVAVREGLAFREDSDIPRAWRGRVADYRGSGFDIGHQRPADDAGGPSELRETFLLSNARPQLPAFNRGRWRELEQDVRKLADEATAVWVLTGPLYEKAPPDYLGDSFVPIASHFFKSAVVLDADGKPAAFSWIVEHSEEPAPLADCRKSVDELEALAGFDIWNLPAALEAAR